MNTDVKAPAAVANNIHIANGNALVRIPKNTNDIAGDQFWVNNNVSPPNISTSRIKRITFIEISKG
jgi:hypothetical protein